MIPIAAHWLTELSPQLLTCIVPPAGDKPRFARIQTIGIIVHHVENSVFVSVGFGRAATETSRRTGQVRSGRYQSIGRPSPHQRIEHHASLVIHVPTIFLDADAVAVLVGRVAGKSKWGNRANADACQLIEDSRQAQPDIG